ncbi:hypothetical protein [Streptomyces sp. NPDC090025]|uniref:hypothetical protein n=1 Tax=Streptomyces sp. NPDC090025 TaxID=3365922 RepID=UPI003835D45E
MLPHRTVRQDPDAGVLRGLRAGVLAVLCVLLPWGGHLLAWCHAPDAVIVAVVAAVAVPSALVLTRRRLTDAQVALVLGASQTTFHLAYAFPGSGRPTGAGLPFWLEHGAAAGPPPTVVLAGHLVTLLIAARVLGVTERLLWQGRSVLDAGLRRLLRALWLRLCALAPAPHGPGPVRRGPDRTRRLTGAVLTRLKPGRAPPVDGSRVSFPVTEFLAPLRALVTPVGGPRPRTP